MEIEIAVLMDGQTMRVNNDLQELLQSLMNSYIRQSVSGKAEKKTKVPKVKVPKVKDPNAPKREPRPNMTEQENNLILVRASQLQDQTFNQAVKIIAREIGRSDHTVYVRLRNEVKNGSLIFKTSVHGQNLINHN